MELNQLFETQLHVLQSQIAELQDAMLKMSVLLSSNEQKENQLLNILEDEAQNPDVLKSAELKIAKIFALKKNFQQVYLNDFKFTGQMNDIQKTNLTFSQAINSEVIRIDQRVSHLETQLGQVLDSQKDELGSSHFKQLILQQYSDQISKMNDKIKSCEQMIKLFENQNLILKKKVKEKISFKDISSLTDGFRSEYVHKMVHESEINKLKQTFQTYLQHKIERTELNDITHQLNQIPLIIHNKINNTLEYKINIKIDELKKIFATKESILQQQAINDFKIKDLASKLQENNLKCFQYTDESINKMNKQFKDIINPIKEEALVLEKDLKHFKDEEEKRQKESADYQLVQRLFDQLQSQFPEKDEELNKLKCQLNEANNREKLNQENVTNFKSYTEKHLEVNYNSLNTKVDESKFQEFKNFVEQSYFTQAQASQTLYKIADLEKEVESKDEKIKNLQLEIKFQYEQIELLRQQIDISQNNSFKNAQKQIINLQQEIAKMHDSTQIYLTKNEYFTNNESFSNLHHKTVFNLNQKQECNIQMIYKFIEIQQSLIKHFNYLKSYLSNLSSVNINNQKLVLEENIKNHKILSKYLDYSLQELLNAEINCNINLNMKADVKIEENELDNNQSQLNRSGEFNSITPVQRRLVYTPQSGRVRSANHARCKRLKISQDQIYNQERLKQPTPPLILNLEKLITKNLEQENQNKFNRHKKHQQSQP